jgi:hypothetical protein
MGDPRELEWAKKPDALKESWTARIGTHMVHGVSPYSIHRRHTSRNRPQQNGVAERANWTMGEDISAMLYEAQLPPSFWGEALAAQIHVWNHLPTSSLKRMIPHEAWFKHKPDISHLRVWGCLAYVHVQKDRRCYLEPHMEKCVFVGYPSGYKGWKFYNPTTQKYVISEHAEFDERVFPGLAKYKATSPVNLTPPNSVLAPTLDPLLNLGGDSDDDESTLTSTSTPPPEFAEFAPPDPVEVTTPSNRAYRAKVWQLFSVSSTRTL